MTHIMIFYTVSQEHIHVTTDLMLIWSKDILYWGSAYSQPRRGRCLHCIWKSHEESVPACLFCVDRSETLKYFRTFEEFFEDNISKMCFQIESYGLVTDKYLIVTQYHKLQLYLTLPIQVSFADMGRNFYLEGLGILQIYEDIFLQIGFTHTAQFLTELAEDIMPVKLFGYISATQMQRSTRKWTLAFVSVMEDLREDTRVTVLLWTANPHNKQVN